MPEIGGNILKNRAKCKLCKDTIESFHRYDFVSCKCGEISIDGGMDYYKCTAGDLNNIIRIDDQGNEIIVTVKDREEVEQKQEGKSGKLSREELLGMLKIQIENIEKLPQEALSSPICHYDYVSGLLLLLAIFKSED